MQKINFDKATIVFSLLTLFLSLEVFLLLPAGFKRINTANRQIGIINRKLGAVESEWPKKAVYLAKEETIKKNIEGLKAKFITPQQESKVLSFISANSEEFGVEITSITPGKPKSHEDETVTEISYLPINIKGTSSFHNLLAFLNYLGKEKYFFRVDSLDMSLLYPRNSMEMTISALMRKE